MNQHPWKVDIPGAMKSRHLEKYSSLALDNVEDYSNSNSNSGSSSDSSSGSPNGRPAASI